MGLQAEMPRWGKAMGPLRRGTEPILVAGVRVQTSIGLNQEPELVSRLASDSPNRNGRL